jgi:actin-related protein
LSTGLTTGLVCQSGGGVTECVPVVNGIAMRHMVGATARGGNDVDDQLATLFPMPPLSDTTSSLSTALEKSKWKRLLRTMKNTIGAVATSSSTSSSDNKSMPAALPTEPIGSRASNYTLPDGRVIQGADETIIKASEILFDCNYQLDQPEHSVWKRSIQDCLISSLQPCDSDIIRMMAQNIGTTSLAVICSI